MKIKNVSRETFGRVFLLARALLMEEWKVFAMERAMK